MSGDTSAALKQAASRASQQPFFLAYIFRQYQEANTVDDFGMAELLGCTVEDLSRIALCRRPNEQAEAFRSDINHLAIRFQVHAEQLASVIRQVDALEAIRLYRQEANTSLGMLRAARDRDEEDTSNTESNDG